MEDRIDSRIDGRMDINSKTIRDQYDIYPNVLDINVIKC